jgi:uncharacterized protein
MSLKSPSYHLVPGDPPSLFVVPGSMLFDVSPGFFASLERGEPSALSDLNALTPAARSTEGTLPPVTALSLNVAQACNLACSYCYADEGKFGGSARLMSEETATRGIDHLIAGAKGNRITVGFIGGEPFLNRKVVHAAVAHARAASRRAGISVRFAITTNATLLHHEDLNLLRQNAFAVTVSIDGLSKQNQHRSTRAGADSTPLVQTGIAPLLAEPGEARIGARVTVTRDDLALAERIEQLSEAGFQEVGISPARTGPRRDLLLGENDWPVLLANMIETAEREFWLIAHGGRPRFANFWVTLRALHQGRTRPLPCGSAISYLSMDVDGVFHSCHRTVNAPGFRMGSLDEGFDNQAREGFIAQALVDQQEPCRLCWARYLCGGGCHAEVAAAGRSGCDYIRGWLDYCLRAYRKIADLYPELLLRGNA